MAANTGISRYLAPRKDATEDAKLAWIRECEQEGTAFLRGCRAYPDLDRGIDIIAGMDDDPVPESLSNVYSNRLKRQLREVVATLSNLRPLWGYNADNEEFSKPSEILNKLVYSWWLSTFADRSIRQAMQWACISTGYLSPRWNPDYWQTGRGDIVLDVYGPRDVLPIQMGKDLDLQQAYACVIQQEVPYFRVLRSFPQYAHKVNPDRDNYSWFRKMTQRILPQRLQMSPVSGLFAEKEATTTSGPICDVFDIYIQDFSINETGNIVTMGEPGTPWEYRVPFLGQDIPVGTDAMGNSTYRKARHEDCMLYPFRRRIQATRHCILYDGPSQWWHGKVPLVRFSVDDWPNEFLGFGLVRDIYPLQKSYNRLLRGVDDAVTKTVEPDVFYDPNLVDRGEVKRYDPRAGRRKIPMNFSMGEGLKIQAPPVLPPYVMEYGQMLRDEMDYLTAMRDMTNLAKVNQIPSAESIDKLMEMAGPIVTDISRGMERSLRDLGELWKCLAYEFYTAPRKIKVAGADGIDPEDFIFEPDTLLPSSMRSSHFPMEIIPANLARAKKAMTGCIFHITPNSLHQMQQMNRKLLYIQLWRDGRFPIDPETVAEACDIPNFGSLEGDENTVLDRWEAWNQKMLEVQMKAQAAVAMQQMQMQAAGMGMVAGQAAAGAEGGPPNGSGKPNGHAHEGRPPSGQRSPHIEQKDGGTRSTISES